MAELSIGQWEIVTAGGRRVIFGENCTVKVSEWSETGVQFDTGKDVTHEFRAAVQFGVNKREPGRITWGMFTDRDTHIEAEMSLSLLAAVFSDPITHATVKATTTLRYNLGRGTRLCYGRPVSITPSRGDTWRTGRIDLDGEWKQADPFFYGDTTRAVTLTGVTPHQTGIAEPLVEPVATEVTPGGVEENIAHNSGNIVAPVRLEVSGPCRAGWVTAGDWWIDLPDIPIFETLIIDTRPAVMAATWATNGERAPLPPSVRLPTIGLPPGQSAVRFGYAGSDGGRAILTWRDAYNSMGD